MKRTLLMLLIVITMLSQTSCGQNNPKSTQTEPKVTKKQYNGISKTVQTYDYNPVYSLRINAVQCTYEVLVNDVLADFSFTKGNTAGEQAIDIPQLILKSGPQRIRVKVFPKATDNGLESTLGTDAAFSIRVVHSDYSKQDIKEAEVYSSKLPQQTGKAPLHEWQGEFDAKVPYTLKGWSTGVDLRKEDAASLQKELFAAADRYRKAYEQKDIETIASMTFEREKELAQAFYMVPGKEENYDHGWEELEKEASELTEIKPIKDYKMRLFGDGKLVTLMRVDGRLRNFPVVSGKSANNKLRFYGLYFFRPGEGMPLKVIR